MSNTIELWMAEDKSHDCYVISKNRPTKTINPMNDEESWVIHGNEKDCAILSPLGLFPELTFENSPKQVELKLLDDEQSANTNNANAIA